MDIEERRAHERKIEKWERIFTCIRDTMVLTFALGIFVSVLVWLIKH